MYSTRTEIILTGGIRLASYVGLWGRKLLKYCISCQRFLMRVSSYLGFVFFSYFHGLRIIFAFLASRPLENGGRYQRNVRPCSVEVNSRIIHRDGKSLLLVVVSDKPPRLVGNLSSSSNASLARLTILFLL